MTQEEIIAGNKLIANFDSLMKMDETDWKKESWHRKDFSWVHISKLQYHSSWDWLMPVVEKIEAIGGFSFSIDFHPTVGTTVMIHRTHEHGVYSGSIAEATEQDKRSAIYNVVLQFIKWLNQQNQ